MWLLPPRLTTTQSGSCAVLAWLQSSISVWKIMGNLINIKGEKDGLRVHLDADAEWSRVLAALRSQLEQGGSFFAGARLMLDVGDRDINEQQLAEALDLMTSHGLRPESIAAMSREGRQVARDAGLIARPLPPTHHAAIPPSSSDAMLISRTVRSGQVVRHHGHITLVGDVNPGAEVIAGGSVIVWGRLRGMVHAGALGETSAFICALELRPTQLRIAALIARTPDDTELLLPEVARVEDDRIVVEPWETFKRLKAEG